MRLISCDEDMPEHIFQYLYILHEAISVTPITDMQRNT
jgi:hypothetical protein